MLLSLVLASAAAPALASPVTVSHATLRVITPAVPAAGYFDLDNNSDDDIMLIGARSRMCGSLTMHETLDLGHNVMRMVEDKRVMIPPGAHAMFTPGLSHLMCERPSPALFTAHTAEITFLFKGGATQNATFTIVDVKGKPR